MSSDVARRTAQRSLFREKASQAVGYRLFSGVTIVMPPSAVVGLMTSIVIVAVLVGAVTIVEVPMRSRAVGVLVPSGGLIDVVANHSGRVEEVFVSAGEIVPSDRLLLSIASGDGSTQGQRLPELHLQSLESELRLLERAFSHEKQLATARNIALREDVQAAKQRLHLGRAALANYLERTAVLEEQFERSQMLASSGHIARDDFDKQVVALLNLRAENTEKELRIVELEQSLALLERSVSDLAEQDAQQSLRHAIEAEKLQREIVSANYRLSGEYRTSQDAEVAHLLVHPGAVVRPGQVLAKLRRSQSTLEAWLYVSTSQARMLQPGQTVELRLDAYPQQVFGTFSATLLTVSGTALLPADVGAPLMIAGPVFEVRAALQDNQIEFANANWPLQPGISFQADIVQRRLRLYEWLFRSISRSSNSSV